MKLVITHRDLVIVSPGEEYDFPDEIAQQLIERGHADTKPEPKKKEAAKAS
jgi:hypothetical protein